MATDSNWGLLTEQERELLAGKTEGVSNPRKIRQHIRQRIRGALDDLAFITEQLEDRDFRQICETTDGKFDDSFRNSYLGTVSLLYKLSEKNDADTEILLWEGLYKAHTQTYPNTVAEIDLSIQSEPLDALVGRVKQKANQGRPLTDLELRALISNPVELESEFRNVRRESIQNNLQSLEQQLRNNLDSIEDGLSAIDEDLPQSQTNPPRPDIIARDNDGQIVLIDVFTASEMPRGLEQLRERAIKLSEMADEYGGKQHVRTILAIPQTEKLPEHLDEELDVEVLSVFDDIVDPL